MVMEVILLGFGHLHQLRNVIFGMFLIIYLLTLSGNVLIVSLISLSPRLHSPMYIFLFNLSICEILFTTVILPNTLCVIWGNGGRVSLNGCITQLYLGASSGSTECLLLTAMAYDRYLAICDPLRYSSIMNPVTRNHLVAWAWITGFFVMSISTFSVCKLQFCGGNTIDHLFCDFAPIVQLSSSDTSLVETEALLIAIALSLFPFLLIITSYVFIFFTILRIPSKFGRQKSFSTCSSHLASVCTYFGSIFIIYLVPSQRSSEKLNKILCLLYIIGTPLLNPIIYSLRNREMKSCFRAHFFIGPPR
ncbi:olfactory receptor 10A3-like [Dendropsophus ebraccatus]|uniref:olfactory receptor 10A3-like n=1 Tax=Dendropsophus ebraccatus TaxID=150705 RepID=UPI003831E628